MAMLNCSCHGANLNCFKCHGSGILQKELASGIPYTGQGLWIREEVLKQNPDIKPLKVSKKAIKNKGKVKARRKSAKIWIDEMIQDGYSVAEIARFLELEVEHIESYLSNSK